MKDPVLTIISSFCLSFISKYTNLFFLMRMFRFSKNFQIINKKTKSQINSIVVDLIMNPFKKSIIGSVLVLTSLLMYYNKYRATGTFELFSGASIFLLLGSLAIYFEYGNDIEYSTYNNNEEEE